MTESRGGEVERTIPGGSGGKESMAQSGERGRIARGTLPAGGWTRAEAGALPGARDDGAVPGAPAGNTSVMANDPLKHRPIEAARCKRTAP